MTNADECVKFLLAMTGDERTEEIAALTAFQGEKDQKLRMAIGQVYVKLVESLNLTNEAVIVELLPLFLGACADKDKKVGLLATNNVVDLAGKITKQGVTRVLPHFLSALDAEVKFQMKVCALKVLGVFATKFPVQLKQSLPVIMPLMHEVLFDTKAAVTEAADECLALLFSKMVSNKDLEPFLPALISSINHLDEVPECIHRLASTTFVQTVDSASLSVIVPLMIRGYREPKNTVHRQCAVIISNMVKLVEEPQEAAPFLSNLVPIMNESAQAMSDPEARGVLERAVVQLTELKAKVDALPKELTHEDLYAAVTKAFAGKGTDAQNHYIADLCRSLITCRQVDAYETDITPMAKAVGASDAQIAALFDAVKTYEKEQSGVVEDDIPAHLKLCDTKFTLAYGSKVLLHNTHLKLIRGHRYGLLGGNDSGKTTLMRAISNGQLDGFPDASEVRTVFVEADIQGDLSHLNNLDYICEDHRISSRNISREDVRTMMLSVGFTEKMLGDNVSTLSGGWRMKLALSRAMLQKADVLLLDEPTNHLDVINVAWVQSYLNSLSTTTSVIVSHDRTMLDNCCTDMLIIENLKLASHVGNLSSYVKVNPKAMSFFELKASKFSFRFPQPTSIPNIKSKGKPLIKMDKVTFTYPKNEKPTLYDVTVRASLSSRVACVGVNGAGKSTMIKLLTGELEPQQGTVWKHEACRLAYVAQHAFHHIEQHLNKTPNEYIRWRYEGGEDKETLNKVTLVLTPEEEAALKVPYPVDALDKHDNPIKVKRIFERLTGARRAVRKENEYEVAWQGCSLDQCTWIKRSDLEKFGAEKHVKVVDIKVEAAAGAYMRALTASNVEKHLEDIGLEKEFASHHRMSALSGGQKVKVVLAAAMWMMPHILILDEPTNYLDRDSLGALADAIRVFDGGVVMITHNNEFCSALCPETWVLENGRLDLKGDAEWMQQQDTAVEYKALETMTDAAGNTVKVKAPKVKMSRQEKKAYDKLRKARIARGEEVSSEDED